MYSLKGEIPLCVLGKSNVFYYEVMHVISEHGKIVSILFGDREQYYTSNTMCCSCCYFEKSQGSSDSVPSESSKYRLVEVIRCLYCMNITNMASISFCSSTSNMMDFTCGTLRTWYRQP